MLDVSIYNLVKWIVIILYVAYLAWMCVEYQFCIVTKLFDFIAVHRLSQNLWGLDGKYRLLIGIKQIQQN